MQLAEMTWQEVDALARTTVVVAPFGATEQHSLHLPVQTDTLIATELASRVDAACGGRLLVLPTQWLGFSPHHMDFAGTVTASSSTYIQLVVETLDSIAQAGFRKFLVLNAHGGNSAILQVALAEFHEKRPDALAVLVTYWNVAAEEINGVRESGPGGMGHACELETSLIMAAQPALVRTAKIARDGTAPKSQFLWKDMLKPGTVTVWKNFSEFTGHGGSGDPTTASAEKGERFFAAIVGRLREVVEEIERGTLL
jgi:creatinine amidohydrolase